MPVLPPNAIQGADADAAEVANVIDPAALGAEQALPPLPAEPATLTPEQLMSVATATPPPALPAASPVDQAIAPLLPPQGGPALSLVPPPAPEIAAAPKTPAEAAQQNVAATKALGEEQVANATEKASFEQERADEEAAFKKEQAERLDALLQRQELHQQAAAAKTADARAKAESEPFHTYWESRSIGQGIATAFGLILGGISWNPNHVNRGVEMLRTNMEHDLAIQKENHAQLWKAVEAAERGEATLDRGQLQEVAKFNAIQGAKHDAVATRLNAAVAMNKGKGDITTAKKVALEEAEKANQFWNIAASAEATANHQKEVDAEAARHHAEQEKTAALRAAKYKTRGGGGGGGGGGREQAAITLTQEIQDAKTAGKPMSMADIDRRAVALKIPLVGKANQITARSIAADAAKETAAAAKAEHTDLVLSEKDEARTVRDPLSGKPLGLAPTARNVKDMAKDLSAIYAYKEKVEKLAGHIEKYGQIVDDPNHPLTEKGKQRMSYIADVQAQGRQLSGIQASDTGTKLEGQMIGHSGVGLRAALNLQSMADPKVLREVMETGVKMTRGRVNAMLSPLPNRGGGASGDEMRQAAERIVSGKSPASEAAKKKAQEYIDAHPKKADITL